MHNVVVSWEKTCNKESQLKYISVIALLGAMVIPQIASADAARAWFTQAEIKDSTVLSKPADALPEVPGTAGKGVLLTQPVGIDDPTLDQKTGYISFWIKPNWNGNDGKTHKLLTIGDPTKNGLLVEKSKEGMLRYVMASPKKLTASRADVTSWKAGEWHHVVVCWYSLKDKPLGLPLYIDKIAVDGPIAGGNTFLNPETMKDTRVLIGDKTSDAVMDELIFRNEFKADGGMLETVWRDYFRTAPYSKIRINPDSCRVPSDKRVVNGFFKQFGLDAYDGNWKMVTANEVRYHPWADFDAKPMIKWSTSNPKVATVDANGKVTAKALGRCDLTAEFRGMADTYSVEVISPEQPDLDLLWVELNPKYKWQDLKDRPAPGDKVTCIAHIENFGFKPVPAGAVVRFELFTEKNNNFVLDKNEMTPVEVQAQTIDKELKPREPLTMEFTWTYPEKPTWFRVTLDPENKVSEICEANNQLTDLSTSRPERMAYVPAQVEGFYKNREINHLGSFSEFDWMTAEKLRFDILVRETVLPETSPVGIRDSFRVDMVYPMLYPTDGSKWEEEPFSKYADFYDGGFPYNEHLDITAIDVAILHEFGHVVTGLPDLYGYPMHADCVYLKDENGKYYAGGDEMPIITEREDTLPYSRANNVPCGAGDTSLMEGCHLSWIHPSEAGTTDYQRGFRGQRFWGVPGRYIPTRANYLRLYDLNDEPLTGAAVYVYHVTQTNCQSAGSKYFADRPKFIGATDKDGRYLFPEVTDESWDDPNTDLVEGAWPVWNPFHCAKTTTGAPPDVAFTPNVWCVEGLLLVKIVKDNHTEFAWISLTDFNQQFFRGNNLCGTIDVRTSLPGSPSVTETVRPTVPEAIQKVNLKPVAKMACAALSMKKVDDITFETTVKPGQEFVLDGTTSADPEKQPLIYHWEQRGRAVKCGEGSGTTFKCTAGDSGETELWFWVNDGLRVSEPVVLRVKIAK